MLAVTIFKAYDVRGVCGTEITEENVRRIGEAFGSYAGGGKVSLGRDTRISGPALQKAFLDGVLSTGCFVQSYEIIPISILSYITWSDNLGAAAYISASHNPPEYNGIRFRNSQGYGMLYNRKTIIKFYNEDRFNSGSGQEIKFDAGEAIARYGAYMEGRLQLNRRLKVVLDLGNGSACLIPPLYKDLGFEVIPLNGTMDGLFPGRGPAPNEKTLKGAMKSVIDNKADYGVGFDPDADRGIVIDDKGRIVPPEKVAIILARRRYKPGDLVISGFDCSMVLEKELEHDGIRVEREKVGDVFVANRVKDSGAVLGVERSGHFFLPEFQYSDDPFAMSLALGEIISEGESLSKLVDSIPDYPYVSESIRLTKEPAAVMKVLEEIISSENPDKTDGLKIATDTSSVLIRPSNTEPLIRLYVETTGGSPEKIAERYQRLVKEAMSR